MSPAASVPAWLGNPAGRASALRRVSDFPGINGGAKITAAIADLTANGIAAGIIDARDLTGRQDITQPIQLGSYFATSYTLLLGRAIFDLTATITVGQFSSIQGETPGWADTTTNRVDPKFTVLRAAEGAAMTTPLVKIGGDDIDGRMTGLEGLYLDGNFRGGGQAAGTPGIFIDRAAFTALRFLNVYDCGGSGLKLNSTSTAPPPAGNESSLTQILGCQFVRNHEHGLHAVNTADTLAMQTQFWFNTGDGLRLTDSNVRLGICDISDNTGFGLNLNSAQRQTLDGCHFANNTAGDVNNPANAIFNTAALDTTSPALCVQTLDGVTFAQLTALGAVANGTIAYVTNGTIANPVAGGGTGCIAKRLNGVWVGN